MVGGKTLYEILTCLLCLFVVWAIFIYRPEKPVKEKIISSRYEILLKTEIDSLMNINIALLGIFIMWLNSIKP